MSSEKTDKIITCPKCGYTSGNDWSQCRGSCPMTMSPHYKEPVDIVDKLRSDGYSERQYQREARLVLGGLLHEAADEIERLRNTIKRHEDYLEYQTGLELPGEKNETSTNL